MGKDNTVQIDEKLNFFNELLLQMVTRVEEALLKATVAFRDHDVEMAKKVIADDYFIDQMREMIENDAVRLLISEAPYGHYMRHVIAGLKMVTSLERMGDHATHLAKVAFKLGIAQDAEIVIVNKIVEMATADAAMFREATVALAKTDAIAAKEIAKKDNIIDAYRKEINELIFEANSSLKTNKNYGNELFELFYLVKELER
ncbi:MAG: phosphate transport system regulatory protein PhoU, partial [Spirochaetaceae bacterium]|nr:phosphate transport system regulatory protein PhoU [Spirochaetaceae bacterium]